MILGLDLSSSSTGYGVLDNKGRVMDFGQIRPPAKLSHGEKYTYLKIAVHTIIEKHAIDCVVLERYFVGGFKTQGTFICAEVRGCIKQLLAEYFPNITLTEEIFPSTLKKIITGSGRATKPEVAQAVLRKLNIPYTKLRGTKSKCTFESNGKKYHDDATDALSLAYCHYVKIKK